MFQADVDLSAAALRELWDAIGRVGKMPQQWRHGLLTPIFKRGDSSDQASYRPICLLSAARKIIERTLVKIINSEFQPHPIQMGFQEKLGTEMAILQTVEALLNGHDWAAILDLIAAYDRVNRRKLLELCTKHLSENTVLQITQLLQPITVQTVGGTTNCTGSISTGVTQGGPASPPLFNIYINPLAVRLAKAFHKTGESHPAKFYAGDVILTQKEQWKLQYAFIICSKWAAEFDVTWSLKVGKSQLLLHPERAAVVKSFPFAGGNIISTTHAEYLGVRISSRGPTAQSWSKRTKAAHCTISALCAAKILFPGVPLNFARLVYITLIQSILDYARYLAPSNSESKKQVERVDGRFFSVIFDMRITGPHVKKTRMMMRLDERELRNQLLAQGMHCRLKKLASDLQSCVRSQASQTLAAIGCQPVVVQKLEKVGDTSKGSLRKSAWQKITATIARKPPSPRQTELPPALQLKQHRLRKYALRWHLGIFPIHSSLFKSVGLEWVLRDLQNLSKSSLSETETSRIVIALETAIAAETTANHFRNLTT